jgi:hypothetical protein
MSKITVITPAGAFGKFDGESALDSLMREIAEKYGNKNDWPEKYGADFENEVFMMHPFCWCEKDDCPWCGGCDCPDSAFHYFVDGKEVSAKEWSDFYASFEAQWFKRHGMQTRKEYDALLSGWLYDEDGAKLANSRRSTSQDAVCDYCKGTKWLDKGAEPGRGAPNFWHKPSGFKCWFYKYIGRGMEVNMTPTLELLAQIRKDCMK